MAHSRFTTFKETSPLASIMVNYYGKEYPGVGDLVVCRIGNSIQDMGYMVSLLEYDDLKGYICLKDLTQAKWCKNIKSLAEEGDIEVLEVITVSEDGDVDLTRRHIDEDAKQAALIKYKHWKRVYDYLTRMATLDDLHEMMDKVLHPYMEFETSESVTEGSIHNGQISNISSTTSSMTISISKWTQEQSIKFTTTSTQVTLDNVIRLIEKPVEKVHQTDHIQFVDLSRERISIVNHFLRYVENHFPVSIKTHNTKTSTFQITTKDKMTHPEFTELVEKIKKCDLQEIKDDHERRKVETEDVRDEHDEHVEQERVYDNDKQPLVNIGIIGHVAHGKTTMIEALTGVDTRKYKKEIASNRTLNIGYTNARITKCSCKGSSSGDVAYLAQKDRSTDCTCPDVLISIVDCPGHNVLLSTMITGARIMDTCLLVVSAAEPCPQPQTQEHVTVMQIIGETEVQFSDALVLLNKIDLVGAEKAAEAKNDLDNFIKGTVFENAPEIPTSAQMRINMSYILEYLYEYAVKTGNRTSNDIKETKENATSRSSKGIVVRTFDVNKPGDLIVKGAVIGGSVQRGTFAIGEDILLLPLNIPAKIITMKSDKFDISVARPGGLIAIQTDINPSYCNMLVGCTFIKAEDFVQSQMIPAQTELKIKYNIVSCKEREEDELNERNERNKQKLLKKDQVIQVNYSGCNSEMTILKSSKDKMRMTVRTSKPIYVFPGENMCFTIIKDKRLVGFGRSLEHERYKLPNGDAFKYNNLPNYAEMFSKFQEKLEAWNETSRIKTRLPIPKTVYKNTFTTIYNFEAICDILNVTPEVLGLYIFTELGARSWSINGMKQFMMKGRTDEKKIMTLLHNFVMDRRCILCKRNTITVVRNMGVKQKMCTYCSWKG